MSDIWNRIFGWTSENAKQYVYVDILKNQTDKDDSDTALLPDRSYFRVWLCEMFLTKSRTWFTEWYPAVHSSVQLKFGNQDTIKFSRVAQAYEEVLSKGVLLNYPLTELMPYNGGTVEVQVALLALKGTDYLGTTLKVLQDFSSLVVAPLGQAISLSQKLSNGIQTFLDTMNGGVHLSLHQAFTSAGGGGANILKPGYIAVILASADQVFRERLSVQNDRLYYKPAEGQQAVPFQGYDYVLLRVEGRQERDDWRLSNIQEPFNRAVEALLQGKENDMKVYRALTLATVYQSPDLVVHDRRRVAQTIKDELALIEHGGLGAVGDEQTDLNVLMEKAMDVSQAIALGNLSFEELLAN